MKKENFGKLITSLKQALEHAEIKVAIDSALKNNRIDSDDDYEKIEVVFDRLMSLKNLGESEETLFLKLADLMEDYEKQTLEPLSLK